MITVPMHGDLHRRDGLDSQRPPKCCTANDTHCASAVSGGSLDNARGARLCGGCARVALNSSGSSTFMCTKARRRSSEMLRRATEPCPEASVARFFLRVKEETFRAPNGLSSCRISSPRSSSLNSSN